MADSLIDGIGRSERKRRAVLDAATDIFLQNGYAGTSMDEIAAQAAVSKQTVYKQFASKEALFVTIITRMTSAAGDEVQREIADLGGKDDVEARLLAYAERQLIVVLTPRLMQLRRLIIAEANRFPELGATLDRGGPQRAVAGLTTAFTRWADRGLLAIDDPRIAASQFNWLVMGDPVNRVMMLGDSAIPDRSTLRRHAAEAVRAFLGAYRPR